MLLSLFLTALAADEPCDGVTFEQRVDSEHFWVTWEDDTLTEEQALSLAQYAEEARVVFADELGWPLTDRPIVFTVHPSVAGGSSGLAQTSVCDDGAIVPNIEIWIDEYDDDWARHLAAHELGHAAQYGYMGEYLDSVSSWLWWMEGTASWMATHVDGRVDFVADEVAVYLDNPHIGLHQGLTAHLDEIRSEHLYGTALLARFLEERAGGPDAIRDTFAYGGPLSGELVAFPDAVASLGLDFDELWTEWLARATVVDLDWGSELDRGAAAEWVGSLPAEGTVSDEEGPEGYGFAAVEFAKGTGERGQALQVVFEGDPAVDWIVVLVRADVAEPPGTVLAYVPLDVVDGRAEGWLSDYGEDARAFLVASPLDLELVGHGFSWSAERIKDPGPMEGTVTLVETVDGCGCSSGAGWGALWLLPLLVAGRRRL